MQRIDIMRQPIQLNKQRFVLASAGLIAVLLLFRDLGGIGVPKIMFIAITSIICVFADKSDVYCLMAFLAPIAHGISYTYISAIALVILLLKQKMKVKLSGFLLIGIILLIELLSALRGLFSYVDYLRFVGVFLIAFLRMIDIEDEYDNISIVKMYLFGYIIAMADIFGQMLKRFSLIDILRLNARLGSTRELLNNNTEGMLLSFNPNTLGFLCTLTVLFCLLLHKKEKKVWHLILIVATTLIGITTQSRTFIVVYLFAILLYVCLSMRSLKSALKSIAVYSVSCGIIVILVNFLIPAYVRGITDRFATSDISNGRIDIMQYYFREMFRSVDRFILGVGLQNYREKYDYFANAHNATQEILITWGIIGLIAVILLFFIILCNSKKINPQVLSVQYVPFIAFLIDAQSGQGFSNNSAFLYLMVIYSAILIPLKKEPTKNDEFQPR